MRAMKMNRMTTMKKLGILVAGVAWALAAGARPFEVVALVDHFDFLDAYDIETPTGVVQCVDHVRLSHATDIWWRDKSGGVMRYPSVVEGWPISEPPFDKLRLPCEDRWGYLRLQAPRAASLPLAQETCAARGVRFGLHTTLEENHWRSNLASAWTHAHPQYWSCTRDGVPFMGTASIGHPEVIAHKLALLDERLAFKPQTIFLDTWRNGDWSAAREYTPRMVARWRERYKCEPPHHDDLRWRAFVAEHMMDYLRQFGAKCRAAGVRFVLGIHGFDGRGDARAYFSSGVDWRRVLDEGVVDALCVMGVQFDPADPLGSTERIYRGVMARRGACDIYLPLAQYNFMDNGIPGYARRLKKTPAETAGILLRLAARVGARGVVLECVDYGNYTPAVNAAIAAALQEVIDQSSGCDSD